MSIVRTRLIKAIKAGELTPAALDSMVAANPILKADLIDLVRSEPLHQRDFYGIPLYMAMRDSMAFLEAYLLGASDYDLYTTSEHVLNTTGKIDWCLGAGDIYNKLAASNQSHYRLTLSGSQAANLHLWGTSTLPADKTVATATLSPTMLYGIPSFSGGNYGYSLSLNGFPAGVRFEVHAKLNSTTSTYNGLVFATGGRFSNATVHEVNITASRSYMSTTTQGEGESLDIWRESGSSSTPSKSRSGNTLQFQNHTSYPLYIEGIRACKG